MPARLMGPQRLIKIEDRRIKWNLVGHLSASRPAVEGRGQCATADVCKTDDRT